MTKFKFLNVKILKIVTLELYLISRSICTCGLEIKKKKKIPKAFEEKRIT